MAFTYFDRELETLEPERLRRLQADKLGAMLGELHGTNAFYTAKLDGAGVGVEDVRSLDELAYLPFTTKAELLGAQEEAGGWSTNATYPEAAYTRFHQTSGTTGVPLRVFDTADSWEWWSRCWAFVLAGAAVGSGDRLILPFSFGPFIGFWAAVGAAEKLGVLMIPGGGRGSLERLHLMRALGVTAMCCTPTYALRLAEVAREEGFDLTDIPMRVTIHAGEPGANVPSTKAKIEAAWGARCYDHVGASEVGAHSFECEAQPGGTHFNDSEFIAEVVDPESGDPVPPGEQGELVITTLGRWCFPVIRYRTGDVVKVSTSRCACGRTFTLFDGGVIGRADDLVVVRGVNVFPAAVENLIRKHAGIDEFRVTVDRRTEMAELVVELECMEGVDEPVICRAIELEFQSVLGLRPEVAVVARGALPRFDHKARRFVTVADS